eukprot:6188646-Pleurochrysis_carterae.AAC.1
MTRQHRIGTGISNERSDPLPHCCMPQNGRCATCQVRLNGRAAAKICQGATIPGGATRKLKVTLDNP